MGLALLATLLGGAEVPIGTIQDERAYIGLDWFILNLFFLALVFVPLERVFARREQRIFRKGWRTDLSHFFVSHMGVQISVLLTMVPAALLFHWLLGSSFQQAVGSQPLWLQCDRSTRAGRLVRLRLSSPLPRRAPALALPRDPSLLRAPRLARLLTPAHRRHRDHPGGGLPAALRTGLLAGSAVSVSDLRVVPGHPDPLESALLLRPAPLPARHAAIPSLASHGAARGDRQELRDPPAGDRPTLRHLPSARRALARALWDRGQPGRLRLPLPGLRVPVPP